MVIAESGKDTPTARPKYGPFMEASLPVKWCSVPLSEVRTRGLRLEAGFYDVEGRSARQRVVSVPLGCTPLCGVGGLADATVGKRFKRIWVDCGGTPIYQPSAVTEIAPEPDGFLSRKTATDLESLRVHAGQILLTCSGSVGRAGIVSRTLDGKVFSHDLLRISCRSPEDTGYVYAFLTSRTGQRLLGTSQYGAVITHIEPEHLASIPVPNAPCEVKRRIHEAVMRSYGLRDESNERLARARELLADALDLPPLSNFPESRTVPFETPQTFDVRLKDLAGRLDGSYHVPVVRAIEDCLRAHAADVATVGDPRVSKGIILPGRFKRVYVEEDFGKVFIGGKQLGELDPSNKKYLSIAHHDKRINDQLTIRENMTLVTCSGTIGRVALVGRHWDGWTASQHILRVVPSTYDIAGYLYVWLSSEWAKPLLVRNSYGAVIDEISDIQLGAVSIPLLADSATQAEINRLALEASSLRADAYDLEQRAMRILEEEVLCGTPDRKHAVLSKHGVIQ